MAMAKLLISIFLTSQMEVTASRLQPTASDDLQGGGHICTIHWQPKDGVEECTASFEVKSCFLNCMVTDTDRHYDKMFPKGFEANDITLGKKKTPWCQCSSTAGRQLLKLPGKCGEATDAQAKCWKAYKEMSTDEYDSEFEKESLRVFHHEGRYHERKFEYNRQECNENNCAEGEDCTQHVLPSLWESRNEKEKKILARLLAKVATREKLSSLEKELLRQFGEEDLKQMAALAAKEEEADPEMVQQILAFANALEEGEDAEDLISAHTPELEVPYGLYDELVAKSKNGEMFTVQELKDEYDKLLAGTFINVDQLAKVAGLTDPDHMVTPEEYEKFLKPDCP